MLHCAIFVLSCCATCGIRKPAFPTILSHDVPLSSFNSQDGRPEGTAATMLHDPP